jgi:hypothetical protein
MESIFANVCSSVSKILSQMIDWMAKISIYTICINNLPVIRIHEIDKHTILIKRKIVVLVVKLLHFVPSLFDQLVYCSMPLSGDT